MDAVETILYRDDDAVQARLSDLGLTLEGLLEARDIAIHDSANATPFHAANAAGTFSYHGGTWGLRNRFVDEEWNVDRADGIEAITNEKLRVRVAFSNVDHACNPAHIPQPRTKKGAGAERATGVELFDDLPHYAPRQSGDWQFYYLMVDNKGAAELTRPVVKRGAFVAAVERIYLSDGSSEDTVTLQDKSVEAPIVFEPQIARK